MVPEECAPLVPADELMIVHPGHFFLQNVPGKAQVHAQGAPCLNGDDA